MFPPHPTFPDGLAYSVFGFFIGIVSGALGVGGGFAYYPFLNIVAGLPEYAAAATSTTQIPFTSLSAAITHYYKKNITIPLGLVLIAGSAPGAITAAGIITYFGENSINSDRLLPISPELLLNSLYVLIITLTGLYTIWNATHEFDRLPSGALAMLPPEVMPPPSLFRMVAQLKPIRTAVFAYIVGFLSTLLGVGGGTFFVPYLMFRLNIPPARAIGTSNAVMLFFSLAAVLRYLTAEINPVNLAVVGYLIVGSVIGSSLGAKMVSQWKGAKTKLIFGIFQLAVVAIFVLVKFH